MQFLFCSGAEYLKIPIIEKGFRLIRSKTQKFANGEMAVSIIDEIDVDEPVCVMQSVALGNVNDYVIELLLCLDALKRVGVSVIDIVLPYMPYARQDRPMDHGYSVGAKVMINLLSEYNPRSVSTIDIHNDRIVAFMDNEMVNITSDIIFENDIKVKFPKIKDKSIIFVALDIGGAVRVRTFADLFGTEYAVVDKRRINGKSEAIRIVGDVYGKTCIVIDDMIDSGGTLFRGAELLTKNGSKEIFCYVTHPVISNTEKFVTDLLASKITHLTVSNTMNNIVDNKKISYVGCINSIVDSVINRVRR